MKQAALVQLLTSLFIGLQSHLVLPIILPVELSFIKLPERLVMLISAALLVFFYWHIMKDKRWALISFSLYFSINLYFSLRFSLYLLALSGPFGLLPLFQISLQVVALILLWRNYSKNLTKGSAKDVSKKTNG